MNTVQLGGVDLNLLLALTALLEERHVTRAAARIGVTQSAMSHALSRLRVLLDDPLFVRTPRGMVPTPRAQALTEPLGRALAQIKDVLSQGRPFDPRTAQRTFRIGAGDYGELVVLPGLVARTLAEAPGIDLIVQALPTDVPDSLESGALDIAVGYVVDDRASIYRQPLFRDRFVCVVREDHPTVKRSLSVEMYAALGHVLVSPILSAYSPPRGPGRGYVDEVLAELGLKRRVAANVPHFLVAPLVVASTNLVLTVPERVARTLEHGLKLKIVECPLDLKEVRMHQMWHERLHGDPAHVWLRSALAKAVPELPRKQGLPSPRAFRRPAK